MSIQESTDVRTATRAEEQRVIDTLVLAFSTDPIMRWFFPSPNDYMQHFPEFVRIYGGEAFDHGTAYYLQDFVAAALWIPPGVQPDEDALAELFQNALPAERQEVAWSIMEQLDGYHPTEPYWHLPVIGADPMQQGKGHGATLMAHALERCDRARELAYLESSNPQNISLYVRHGFEILGVIREETMPPLIPMVRKPQG